MKSGNLNFLEPSGPLQACNGTDLLCINYKNMRGLNNTEFANSQQAKAVYKYKNKNKNKKLYKT